MAQGPNIKRDTSNSPSHARRSVTVLSAWLLSVVCGVFLHRVGGVQVSGHSQHSSFHHRIGHSDLIEQVRQRGGGPQPLWNAASAASALAPADLFRQMLKQVRAPVTGGPERECVDVEGQTDKLVKPMTWTFLHGVRCFQQLEIQHQVQEVGQRQPPVNKITKSNYADQLRRRWFRSSHGCYTHIAAV